MFGEGVVIASGSNNTYSVTVEFTRKVHYTGRGRQFEGRPVELTLLEQETGTDMIEPSDTERAELPDTTYKYLSELEAENNQLQKRYNELIMGVATKHPGESRHETALRYIQNTELSSYPKRTARVDLADKEAFEKWARPILGDNPTWRESGQCELAWQAWQEAFKAFKILEDLTVGEPCPSSDCPSNDKKKTHLGESNAKVSGERSESAGPVC
jgi:hypothetical protein